ncbi:DUF4097 family beta strand repeat-containing protein [Streptomyces sp. NPDC048566]|uniref:DUF4097 family beta strand repeat-containing protein n=1 Tax=Streptomyces sp. NPDC048566 TaxID=3365569 RepID=UPI0037227C11
MAVVVGLAGGCGASAADDRHPDHRSFALHGRTLTVDSDDSALEIVTSETADPGRVAVTRWFQGHVTVGGDPRVTWAMEDEDRLVLRMKCSGVIADCSARHRIVVPRGVAVIVRERDGSVSARGFTERLSVRTADGSVRVGDSSGPLDLRTADGSIQVLGTAAPRVRARTEDGSVHLELAAVPDLVDARTDDGSVSIVLPRARYRVAAGTGDGSVRVDVERDASSPHRVSAHTADGGITVRTAN